MTEVSVANQECSVNESDYIEAVKRCDLWVGIKRFSNMDNALVAEALYDHGAQTLAQLREKTGLSTNRVNHALFDMRNAEIITKTGKTYCITVYGALIHESIKEIKTKLRAVPDTSLFRVVTPAKKYIPA